MFRMQHFARAALLVASTLAGIGAARAQGVLDEWNSVRPPPAPQLKDVALDPHTTALLVMDFNKANCRQDKRERCVGAVPHVRDLLAKARAADVFVVYTITAAMKPGDFVAAIAPKAVKRTAPLGAVPLATTVLMPWSFRIVSSFVPSNLSAWPFTTGSPAFGAIAATKSPGFMAAVIV